ncbi:MAG: GNAT family N-acetyltransferase [Candidatus Binataceae bacterium]
MPPEEIPADFGFYAMRDTLRDGEKVMVRAIHPDDKARLLEHFRSLSPTSIHNRFFSMRRDLSPAELARLTELDFRNHVGLAVTLGEADAERFIGVGRYIRGADSKRAEVAFAVTDQHQGRGVGTLLLEHLAHIARAQSIEHFDVDVLADNHQMLGVVEQSGFRVHRKSDSGVVHMVMPLAETEESGHARGERANTAAQAAATNRKSNSPRH